MSIAIAFQSPDGTRTIASGGWGDNYYPLMGTPQTAKTKKHILQGHNRGVSVTVAFSPDGQDNRKWKWAVGGQYYPLMGTPQQLNKKTHTTRA